MTPETREKWNTTPRNRSGVCYCGQPSRKGQGYCSECHAASERMYRRERAAKRQTLETQQ